LPAPSRPKVPAKIWSFGTIAFSAFRNQTSLNAFAYYDKLIYPGQKVLGAVDPNRVAKLQDFYLAKGIIQKKSPADELYTNQFVEYGGLAAQRRNPPSAAARIDGWVTRLRR
jgi:hypothetical protein